MEWQSLLIETYLNVCDCWNQGFWTTVQRYSNHKIYEISDEEVATIYIYGIISGKSNAKETFKYQVFPENALLI